MTQTPYTPDPSALAFIVKIHLTERTDSTPTERLFDGWIEGCANVFPGISQMCAMNTTRAIAWAVEVEKRAYQWSEAKKTNLDGSASYNRIYTQRVFENFS